MDGVMNRTVRILGIPGSLRRASFNRATLRAAQERLPEGVTLEIFDLAGIPAFSEDDEAALPTRVVELKARIRQADAILIATPEYNYSVPGVLKNAIDWASRPYGDNAWEGKPVAIVGASVGTTGTARAQYHLRQTFVYLNMYPLNRPEIMISGAAQRFDERGRLVDEVLGKRLEQLLEALVAWTQRLALDEGFPSSGR
jgi:chromate reductase, NAD(P)H dehydrogenase (quinone)